MSALPGAEAADRSAWLALGAALAAFVPSLFAAFQFDDFNVIVQNPAVHSWGGFFDELGRGIRPALKASYAFNWTLGLGAPGFHAFNVALHGLNALLVFRIGLRLAARWQVQAGAGAALAAALVFALHPVQTEAVTYVSGRSSALAASFYLGALLVYLRGGHWAASGLLFILAAASKETALTLPAALLLCELSARERPGWRVVARRQAAHWLLLVLMLGFALAHARYRNLLEIGLAQRSAADNLLTQVGGIGYLVSRLFAPHHLNIDPALPVLMEWDATLVLQVLLLSVLLFIGILNLRKRPWLGFGICWFFLQLAPTNSLLPRIDVANERQLYLALWGLAVALAVQLAQMGFPKRVLPAPTIAVLAALAITCVQRQLDYRSEIGLWSASVRESPWNARAWNNLGYAHALEGNHEKAVPAYLEALAFAPENFRARQNLEYSRAAMRAGGARPSGEAARPSGP